MKNTLRITIQKNKQTIKFYIDDQEHSFARVLARCKEQHVSLCHIQTFEGERKLVDCYLPYQEDETFRNRLIKAAKAKA